jgi:GNAT superfamily N-acetyltransferase
MMAGNNEPVDILIRKFRCGDLADVKRLIDRTIGISYPGMYPQEAIDYFLSYHTAEHILEDAERGCTLVLETDQITGTGTLLGSTIKRVFVNPSCHRRGFGTLLMQALENEALCRGIGKVDLSASLPSKLFYDTLGYGTECEAYIPVQNGKHLKYYEMVKDLG